MLNKKPLMPSVKLKTETNIPSVELLQPPILLVCLIFTVTDS